MNYHVEEETYTDTQCRQYVWELSFHFWYALILWCPLLAIRLALPIFRRLRISVLAAIDAQIVNYHRIVRASVI